MKSRIMVNAVNKQVQGSGSEQYVDQVYLSLFRDIVEAQWKIEGKLALKDIYPAATGRAMDEVDWEGLPLIYFNKLRLDEKLLYDLLEDIRLIIASYTVDENPTVPWLLQATKRGDLSLGELALKAALDDREYLEQLSKRIGCDIKHIMMIGELLVSPFLRVCAKQLREKIDLELVRTGRCPVCGGMPLVSRLRAADRKRVLECSLCNTQWVFKRIECPFCDNQNQDTLGFFYVHKESAYRVDTCGKCKRYIKTVDMSKRAEDKEMPLLVEDMFTLHLDVLAVKEGFKNAREQES